mgnify:CR=1 FL=1
MKKIRIAYVCVHNSCRSQIAEALTKLKYPGLFEAYSAGTVKVNHINQDAVRNMKDLLNVDMEKDQYSKLVESLPAIDIVITMGCNVDCPYLPCQFREDWGLNDPSGQSDEEFIKTIKLIELKLDNLVERINNRQIKIE